MSTLPTLSAMPAISAQPAMSSSLFVGDADHLSAAASEIFPYLGPVAPLEALLEPSQCTLRLAGLRTALADEAMLDLAFEPRREAPWSKAVRQRVEAYTDGLVEALCAQHLPSALIVRSVASHMALASGDEGARLWLEARGIAVQAHGAGRPACTPPPFSSAPMARGSFRIESFAALPRFTSQLFLCHPSVGALSPLLSKTGARRLAGLSSQVRRSCLRYALHRDDPALSLRLSLAFRDWEKAARHLLLASGWQDAELDRRVASGHGRVQPELAELAGLAEMEELAELAELAEMDRMADA